MKKTAIRVGEERGEILLKKPTDLKKNTLCIILIIRSTQ
jgi:hypothetical protein